MITTTETRNPNALEQVFAEADKVLAAMTEVGALELYDALDESTSSRTGEQYPNLPRRSSMPAQMPQRQSGGLQNMVDYGQSGELEHWFGLDPEGREEEVQAIAMELGAPRANVVGRQPVRRISMRSQTHAKMIAAARTKV